jgi:hypothetical protein
MKFWLLIGVIGIQLIAPNIGFCQNTLPLRPYDTIRKRDDGRILYFRRINEYPYYQDKAKFEELNRLAKTGDLQKTYHRLYDYVMEFGIKNFYKDLYLIWRLGKLAEQLGYVEKAKSFYRLVLKHHREGNEREKRLFYDSLSKNDLDFYLPVEYYYTYANASANIDTLDIPESIYTNVGDSVNSRRYNDYGPALTGNDLTLIFTSQREQRREGPKYIPNEDLFTSRKADSLYLSQTAEGTKIDTIPWTASKPLKSINTKYNEGSPCISKDGNYLYFSRCYSPDGFGNCDIYVSHKQQDGSWGKAYNLGININGIGWESQPALSHTGDTLFFSSDRLGGFGMADIYYSYRTGIKEIAEGDTIFQWAKALNIGPMINTRFNEVSPFYHPKQEVLYFSSNGQLVNFGGFDIYKSYKNRGQWSEPKNIGPLVNYKKDEYYFTIDSKARNLYYAKLVKTKYRDPMSRDTLIGENLDIHQALLPMEAQPEAIVKFEGAVTDSITGKAFEGIVSIIDMDEGIEVAPKYLRPDGSYRFDLVRDHNYLVIITGEDFFRIERQFLLKGDTTMNIATPSIRFKKWKFEALEFAEGSAVLMEQMKPDLEKLVFFLADHPNLGLKIVGHTNATGSKEGNLRLSQARADAIKNYIIDRGRFKPDRIEAIGLGNDEPIVEKEETDEHRHLNRRVEFEIVKLK